MRTSLQIQLQIPVENLRSIKITKINDTLPILTNILNTQADQLTFHRFCLGDSPCSLHSTREPRGKEDAPERNRKEVTGAYHAAVRK